MRTIELQIQDDIYDELKNKGIDISHKLQEFLFTLADDGYPAISTDEAKRRVSEAVERYRNGSGTYINSGDYLGHKSEMVDSIKSKYANH